MVRSELLKKMCDLYPNMTRKDIAKILEIIFFEITEALNRGENIEIRGFGTYKLAKRKARIGRNPKTGNPVSVPEKNIPWEDLAFPFVPLTLKSFFKDLEEDNFPLKIEVIERPRVKKD